MAQLAFSTIYEEVIGALTRIEAEEQSIQTKAERSIAAVRETLDRIRQTVIQTSFDTEAEEIHFFKFDKPRLASRLAYFTKINKIERGFPVGSQDLQLGYLHNELAEIDQFYTRYPDFHEYYRSGSTARDAEYFVRGRQDVRLLLDTDWIYADPAFSTGYDLLAAKLLANEALLPYLNSAIARVTDQPSEKPGVSQNESDDSPTTGRSYAQTPLKGVEIYVFLKALIDAQGVVNHTYKSFFELVVPGIANMQQKSFAPNSLLKYSDKVDPESRENVKRLLSRMIRNIDTY